MRRCLAAATLAAAAALTTGAPAASACDPNGVPGCQSHCAWVAWRYSELAGSSSIELPPWPHTGVARCP